METIVAVPVWDNGIEQFEWTENFTNQCLSQTQGDFGLCVIDNGSPYKPTTDFLDYISTKDPRFKCIRNRKNIGYGAAANQGVKWGLAHGATYCIVLNNDIVIQSKEWLQSFIAPLRENLKQLIGARVIPDNSMTNLDGQGCIPYVEGWGMAFHKNFIRDAGYMDTKYLAYYEDVDISVRAMLAGYTITQSPDFQWASDGNVSVARYVSGTLLHVGGTTGYSTPSFKWQEVTQKSRDYFVKKWGLVPQTI